MPMLAPVEPLWLQNLNLPRLSGKLWVPWHVSVNVVLKFIPIVRDKCTSLNSQGEGRMIQLTSLGFLSSDILTAEKKTPHLEISFRGNSEK